MHLSLFLVFLTEHSHHESIRVSHSVASLSFNSALVLSSLVLFFSIHPVPRQHIVHTNINILCSPLLSYTKQVTGAYSNSNAIRYELCVIMSHQCIHKMHENITVRGRRGLAFAAQRRVRHNSVRRVRGSHFVHTENLFIDLVRF